jgi:Zn-dependent protease
MRVMKWNYNLTRIDGTNVRIHLTFVILLAWITLSELASGGFAAAFSSLMLVGMIFGSVLLHEFGHIFAAKAFGIHTPDVTLYPIGGVARLERMPTRPFQELVITLAGPLVNVAIAIVLALLVGIAEVILGINAPMFALVAKINIGLALFNMIPAFPMDGGRVLRSLLAMKKPYLEATGIAVKTGKTLAIIFGVLGLFYDPMLILIATFVFFAASKELQATQAQAGGPRNAGFPFGNLHGRNQPNLSGFNIHGFSERFKKPQASTPTPIIDESGNVVGWTQSSADNNR